MVVITTEALKEELLAQGLQQDARVTWLAEPALETGADCYIDLLFDGDAGRLEQWTKTGATVLVNSMNTSAGMPPHFVRINAWPGFLKRQITEASCTDEAAKRKAEIVLGLFGKKAEWVTDKPGFITARVISMIINEAYLALEEEVSTKEEIDTAMKLGTNYPYGPFEWAHKIGLKKIYELLHQLAQINDRYQPASLLKKEALT